MKKPGWLRWKRLYFIIYESGCGFWFHDSEKDQKTQHLIVPNEYFYHDRDAEEELMLSARELKTEFVVSGTHTHLAVSKLEKWHCQVTPFSSFSVLSLHFTFLFILPFSSFFLLLSLHGVTLSFLFIIFPSPSTSLFPLSFLFIPGRRPGHPALPPPRNPTGHRRGKPKY